MKEITLVILISLLILTACTTKSPSKELVSVSAEQFYELTKNSPDTIIIDVRTPEEFRAEHIENAVLINYYESNFEERLSSLDKEKTYLIYCRCGARSGNTLQLMSQLGFTSVYNLDEGINSWNAKKLPTVQ